MLIKTFRTSFSFCIRLILSAIIILYYAHAPFSWLMTGRIADLRLRMVKDTGLLGAAVMGAGGGSRRLVGAVDWTGRVRMLHLSALEAIANNPPKAIKNGNGSVNPCIHW